MHRRLQLPFYAARHQHQHTHQYTHTHTHTHTQTHTHTYAPHLHACTITQSSAHTHTHTQAHTHTHADLLYRHTHPSTREALEAQRRRIAVPWFRYSRSMLCAARVERARGGRNGNIARDQPPNRPPQRQTPFWILSRLTPRTHTHTYTHTHKIQAAQRPHLRQ